MTAPIAQGPVDVNVGRLAARALDVCKQRGWSLRWDARLAQMTCESAEFAEAVRGKRGDPVEEAGDVLFVLMSWTESAGIPFADVVAAAERKCLRLEIVPRYAGEQFETPNAELRGGPEVSSPERPA